MGARRSFAVSAVLTLALVAGASADSSKSDGSFFDGGSGPVPQAKFRFRATAPAAAAADAAAVPLALRPMGPRQYHLGQIVVPCAFDGNAGQCLLDTGAGVNVLYKGPPWADRLPANGSTWDLTGACDRKPVTADGVDVADFRLGQASFGPAEFERMESDPANHGRYAGVVGMQILSKASRFSLRLMRSPALVLDPPQSGGGAPFSITSEKQIILSVPVGGVPLAAVFDTGSNATIVDVNFAKDPRNGFVLVPGSDKSYAGCSTGSKREVALYRAAGLQIGNVSLAGRDFVAFDLSDLRKNLGNDQVEMILGYDVISRFDWTFDWKSRTWAADSGVRIQSAENRPPPGDDYFSLVQPGLAR